MFLSIRYRRWAAATAAGAICWAVALGAQAPSKPRIGMKFLVTTVISAIVWVLIYLTITSGLISFRT